MTASCVRHVGAAGGALVYNPRPGVVVKFIAVLCAVVVSAAMSAQQSQSFYDLKTTSLDGKPADLGQFKGKVSLVINVASQCGYTRSTPGSKSSTVS